MERVFREKPIRKPGGGLNDRPVCERCGKPVRITSDDYLREEILCAHCAADAKVSSFSDDAGRER